VPVDLEKQGKLKIVGAMYNISTGRVSFLSAPGQACNTDE